jgi:hypothetical protein
LYQHPKDGRERQQTIRIDSVPWHSQINVKPFLSLQQLSTKKPDPLKRPENESKPDSVGEFTHPLPRRIELQFEEVQRGKQHQE